MDSSNKQTYEPETLVWHSARTLAPHITPAHVALLPTECHEHLQVHMGKDRQVELFADWKRFNINNRIISHGSYRGGKLHGVWKEWFSDGRSNHELMWHGHYNNGKKDGEWKRYFSHGQLFEHKHYKNGKLDGDWIEWHFNGRLYKHVHYKDGKKHGELKRFNGSGRMWLHTHYKDGKQHGEHKEWYNMVI